MKTLVLGASGQVGSALVRLLPVEEPCLGTCHRFRLPGLVPLDLGDVPALEGLLRQYRPDVCFLPGAWTHVDGAEQHPGDCRRINVDAVACVAKCLAEQGGTLILFSTDHVFPARDRLWREDEPVAPVSVYGRSKVEAETVLRDILPGRHLILRTSWVYGPDPQGKNFVCRVRDTLRRGETLVVPSDQWGQPTFAPDLARTAWNLVRRQACGTFHVVGPRWLDRLTWARIVAGYLGLDDRHIEGRPTAELGTIAPRPLRVGLDSGKLRRLFGTESIRDPSPHEMLHVA